MSYSKLFFDSIGIDYDVEGVNPHFICPSCRKRFEPKFKPTAILPATFNFNQKVTFLCPNCGAKIILFVAIHKDENGLAMCIQRSDAEGADGISANWWQRTAKIK
jgi:predicted RNA-binding Zn-ribbon protein involved in translation (DUF1610 family)